MKTQQEHKQELFNFLADWFGVTAIDSDLEHIIDLCAPIIAQRLLSNHALPGELFDLGGIYAELKKLAFE